MVTPMAVPTRSGQSIGLPGRVPAWIVAIVATGAVIIDQATKHLAVSYLQTGRNVAWLSEGFGWQLTFNDGGAFGVDAPSAFFLVVTVVVTVIVVRQTPGLQTELAAWAYGLLLAGAWGNALDRVFRLGDPGDPRFFHGHVVDFVAWGSWPRFNGADVAITFGFVLLVVQLWSEERAGAP
jgi:signal peptidase II